MGMGECLGNLILTEVHVHVVKALPEPPVDARRAAEAYTVTVAVLDAPVAEERVRITDYTTAAILTRCNRSPSRSPSPRARLVVPKHLFEAVVVEPAAQAVQLPTDM
jgi:hypothetical protein